MITYVESLACNGTPAEVAARSQALCSEAVAAGDYVTVYNVSGVATCRLAIATDEAHLANGFVLGAHAAGQWTTVYGFGANDAVASQVPGVVYLSATVAGKGTAVAPTLAQQLGFALHAGLVVFQRHSGALPKEVILKETVFAGMTPQTFADGVTVALDGLNYAAAVPAGASVSIVATGLQIVGATSASAEVNFALLAGSPQLKNIVTNARFRRGRWAIWFRWASYSFGSATSPYLFSSPNTQYPNHGLIIGRAKNSNGCPNTSIGGVFTQRWWQAGISTSNPAFTTNDCFCVVFNGSRTADVYSGVFSGGWPAIDDMTHLSAVDFAATSESTHWRDISLWTPYHTVSGGTTVSLIVDRWRVTAYD